MKKFILFFTLFFSLFLVPAFASGNLTISRLGCDGCAPSHINTRQVYNMLNLSLNVTPGTGDGTVNITSMNVTIVGTAPISSIAKVEIKDVTGDVIASNTTNATATKFTIHIPNGLFINASSNASILIVFNISPSATRFNTTGANISASSEIGTTSNADNITITGNSIQSNISQIQDLHAIAYITPRTVDTNVENQTFIYTINRTGSDKINRTEIVLPSEYVITNVNATIADVGTLFTIQYSSNQINITNIGGGAGTNGPIIVNFSVNTSSSSVNSMAFNSTIFGGNLSASPDVINQATSVITKQIIIVQDINPIKTTALVNGTDYWEFNLTLNITANVSGLIQFKMNNWNSSEGYTMNLTNQTNINANNTLFYASLRSSGNSTNYINVTNNYDITRGISLTATAGNLYYVILKMIIPSGTPTSSTWWTTYSMLFRSSPT